MMVSGLYLVETSLVHEKGVVVAHKDNGYDETLLARLGDDFCGDREPRRVTMSGWMMSSNACLWHRSMEFELAMEVGRRRGKEMDGWREERKD
jgi:hypothetical protein